VGRVQGRRGVFSSGYLIEVITIAPVWRKHHYYSRILKFVITILDLPQICHRIHTKTTRVQLQVYTKMYISLYLRSPINDMWAPLVSIIFFLSSSLTQQHPPPSMARCSSERAWHCVRAEPRGTPRGYKEAVLRATAGRRASQLAGPAPPRHPSRPRRSFPEPSPQGLTRPPSSSRQPAHGAR
jgi:hypothetical protein